MMADSFMQILRKAQQGEQKAWNLVYQSAYLRLRNIAGTLLRSERRGHTLQATALVNEAFLKIFRMGAQLSDREHFYSICARAMRQVLIDHSRVRRPVKKISADTIADLLRDSQAPVEMSLAARQIFERFERLDSRAAETVWMRCVEGRTLDEVSRAQSREVWKVRADCDFGLKWMADRL